MRTLIPDIWLSLVTPKDFSCSFSKVLDDLSNQELSEMLQIISETSMTPVVLPFISIHTTLSLNLPLQSFNCIDLFSLDWANLGGVFAMPGACAGLAVDSVDQDTEIRMEEEIFEVEESGVDLILALDLRNQTKLFFIHSEKNGEVIAFGKFDR